MYRFLYNNYTFWIKKKKTQRLTRPPRPKTILALPLTQLVCDHSPAPSPWPSTVPGMCQAYPCLQGFCTCLPLLPGILLPPNIPPLNFTEKCPAQWSSPDHMIKFINSPPILAYPPCLLHFLQSTYHPRNMLRICCSLPVSSLNLGNVGKGIPFVTFTPVSVVPETVLGCTQCKYCWMNEWVNKRTNA